MGQTLKLGKYKFKMNEQFLSNMVANEKILDLNFSKTVQAENINSRKINNDSIRISRISPKEQNEILSLQ